MAKNAVLAADLGGTEGSFADEPSKGGIADLEQRNCLLRRVDLVFFDYHA